jgi:hypothetical protein
VIILFVFGFCGVVVSFKLLKWVALAAFHLPSREHQRYKCTNAEK